MRVALVVASIVATLLTVACGPDQHCSAGSACAGPASYDLVLTEADSGKAGISMGGGVAFLLDSGHNRLVTTPAMTVRTLDDPYKQFPGKHAFSLAGYQSGVFDVVATGSDSTPFTFHLVIGQNVPITATPMTVVHLGDLIVQEAPPTVVEPLPRLRSPIFELVQAAVTVGAKGRLLDNQPVMARQAFRAAELGTQVVKLGVRVNRVIVVDTPPAFRDFVDIRGQAQDLVVYQQDGGRFAIVVMGDARPVTWSAQPVDAAVRLPDADVGPQPPGATLVPFKVLIDGVLTFRIRSGGWAVLLSVQSGETTCLPNDFPRYPLATTTGASYQGPCSVDMATTDPIASVLSFYSLRLNEGDWLANSAGGSTLHFARRSNSATAGTLDVAGGAIHIRMNREVPIPSPMIP
jgi:hypothetical protein